MLAPIVLSRCGLGSLQPRSALRGGAEWRGLPPVTRGERAISAWIGVRDEYVVSIVNVSNEAKTRKTVQAFVSDDAGASWKDHSEGFLEAEVYAFETAGFDRDGSVLVVIDANVEGRSSSRQVYASAPLTEW